MAAAALLRSLARKIARAQPPPPHPLPRPLLARGLHGSGLGASSPPPIRNQPSQDGRGIRLVVGMAAAGLPSLPSKMARAPPHHRLLHDRGLHSRTSTSPRQPIPTASKIAFISLVATTSVLYFWVKPVSDELAEKIKALSLDRDVLKEALHECQGTHTHVLPDSSPAKSKQALGHSKEADGATDSETRIHNLRTRINNLEEEIAGLHRVELEDGIKNLQTEITELEDDIKNLQTKITELNIALESARAQGNM